MNIEFEGVSICIMTQHYENLPMQFTEISKEKMEIFRRQFLIFFLFLLKTLIVSTRNLCFGSKIRKIGIPLQTPVLLYKSGVYGGIQYTDMFFDDKNAAY